MLGQALLAKYMSSQPHGTLDEGLVKDPKPIKCVSSLSQARVFFRDWILWPMYHLLLRE